MPVCAGNLIPFALFLGEIHGVKTEPLLGTVRVVNATTFSEASSTESRDEDESKVLAKRRSGTRDVRDHLINLMRRLMARFKARRMCGNRKLILCSEKFANFSLQITSILFHAGTHARTLVLNHQ